MPLNSKTISSEEKIGRNAAKTGGFVFVSFPEEVESLFDPVPSNEETRHPSFIVYFYVGG